MGIRASQSLPTAFSNPNLIWMARLLVKTLHIKNCIVLLIQSSTHGVIRNQITFRYCPSLIKKDNAMFKVVRSSHVQGISHDLATRAYFEKLESKNSSVLLSSA